MPIFQAPGEVRERNEKRVGKCSEVRPHDALDDLTHWKHLAQYEPADNSNLGCHWNGGLQVGAACIIAPTLFHSPPRNFLSLPESRTPGGVELKF
jgi:hypothetical protein